MSTQMLEIGGQSQAVGTNTPTSDEMSEMSAFVLQSFQPTNNAVGNSVAGIILVVFFYDKTLCFCNIFTI